MPHGMNGRMMMSHREAACLENLWLLQLGLGVRPLLAAAASTSWDGSLTAPACCIAAQAEYMLHSSASGKGAPPKADSSIESSP